MTLPSELLEGEGLASGVAMAAMALVSVGLWTLRVTLAARGRKLAAAAAASLEAVVFAVVFSSLAASLDAPTRVLGYAVGVAAGTMLGLFLDERGARGTSEIQVVVHGHDAGTAETLRGLGWPATSFLADGPDGPVTVVFLAARDTEVAQIQGVLRQKVPDGFWAVQPLRQLHPSLLRPASGAVPATGFASLPGLSRPALHALRPPIQERQIRHARPAPSPHPA